MCEMYDTIPEDWVNWIRTCCEGGSDFFEVRDILFRNFEGLTVDYWLRKVWYEENGRYAYLSGDDYDTDHVWFQPGNSIPEGVEIEYLNRQPTIALIRNVLSDEECDQIIDDHNSEGQISRATVCGEDYNEHKVDSIRTNSLAQSYYGNKESVVKLEKRIAEVTNIDIRRGESSQILYYTPGQEFKPHHDFFHRSGSVSQMNEYSQRIATVITYLNDVEEGGETSFPNLDITVKPNKGDALYFEYTDPTGYSTNACLHAGCPVIKGEKWAVTKWLRLGYPMPEQIFEKYYN